LVMRCPIYIYTLYPVTVVLHPNIGECMWMSGLTRLEVALKR
jgi:hypothetical protein